MVLQTQLEFAQLANELAGYTRRDVTQGIKLARFRKAAKGMLKKDPVCGHTLLGMVSCFERDLPAMHASHAKAIELAENSFTLMFYALSLQRSCLWAEAVRYALMALDHHPEDPKLLHAAIEVAPLTGRFSLLKRLVSQWEGLNGGAAHPAASHFEIVSDTLASQGLTEKDLKAVLAAIGDTLSQTDVILKQYRYDLVCDKDASYIHYRFILQDQSVASYYEDRVAARLGSFACHPRTFDVFSFSVENSTVYDLYDCMDRELAETADTIRVPDPEKMKLIEDLIAGVEV